MEQAHYEIWIEACAHRLQMHWRTVDPLELEAVAAEIWRDPSLRSMAPRAAATQWLQPMRAERPPIGPLKMEAEHARG